MTVPRADPIPGVPPGSVAFVLEILRASPKGVRRRDLLVTLEHRGHRISLAGLNRILEECARLGLTHPGPDGIRASEVPSAGPQKE